MKTNQFFVINGLGVLLGITAAWMIGLGTRYYTMSAVAAGLAGLYMLKYIERESRKSGRTDTMKISLALSFIGVELALFVGASSPAIIPKYMTAMVIAGIGFNELARLELQNRLKASFSQSINRTVRVVLLLIAVGAQLVNIYTLYYGLAVIFVLTAYDTLTVIGSAYRNSK